MMKLYHSTFVMWLVAILRRISGETETLLEEPGADLWYWTVSKESKIGAGWNHPSTQSQVYTVCDISQNEKPKNWLITEFINIKNAKRLDIEVTYTLLNCPLTNVGSFCRTNFSLYSYHINSKIEPAPDPKTLTFNEETVITPETLPEPNKRITVTFYGSVVTKAKGIYLAFLDQGTCLTIRKVVVRYHYCAERGAILAKFPRTVAPANDINLTKQEGECTDPNSRQSNKGKLFGVCLSNGEWNITSSSACFCNKGYELTNGSSDSLACRECPIGFYKSTDLNTKCLPCPANAASNAGRTCCTCDKGYYVPSDGSDCKELPKAPLTANVTVVTATVIKISWQRSPDDFEDGALTYAIDCFRCLSEENENCKEPCNPDIQYSPSKENISGVEVTIYSLPSSSYLLFRVYSVNEMNQQEENRDDWNFAEVFVKTKVSTVPPTEGETGTNSISCCSCIHSEIIITFIRIGIFTYMILLPLSKNGTG